VVGGEHMVGAGHDVGGLTSRGTEEGIEVDGCCGVIEDTIGDGDVDGVDVRGTVLGSCGLGGMREDKEGDEIRTACTLER
jgi:hypothetical protein